MKTMDRTDLAVSYKHNGCNCCQAVLMAYAEDTGVSEELLMKLGVGFGSGMGGMEGDCGALCGAVMVLGLLEYQGAPIHRAAKQLYDSFREKSGATVCGELKGIGTGSPICSCDDCVRHAVEALESLRETM